MNPEKGICAPFVTALAFLTRLAPARRLSEADLAPAIPWFAAAGLTIGCLATMASACLGLALPAEQFSFFPALLMGGVWLIIEIWLSHGMHWDGVADLADALGSGASGERFWQIMQDSRLGSYGALCLISIFGLQWLLASWHFSQAFSGISGNFQLQPLIFLALAPAWGRLEPAWLSSCPAAPASRLGKLICNHHNTTRSLAFFLSFSCLVLCCILGLPPVKAFLLGLAQWCLNRFLSNAARRHGGMSGDFFGAGIEMGQTLFLLLTIL